MVNDPHHLAGPEKRESQRQAFLEAFHTEKMVSFLNNLCSSGICLRYRTNDAQPLERTDLMW